MLHPRSTPARAGTSALPAGNASPAAACMHLQPTDRCSALDSSLHSTASSTASTATIAAARSPPPSPPPPAFFRRLRALSAAAAAAAGRCEAARSSKAAIKVAVATHQGGGHLQAARAARPRAPGSSGDALRPANDTRSALVGCRKKSAHGSGLSLHLWPFWRASAPASMPLDRPKRGLHVGMRLVC